MTLEELLAVAEIVEKLTNRYRDQEAAHKAALTEIRASFNARTSADGKRHEGILDTYRSELDEIDAVINPARAESTVEVAKRLVIERDGLRAEVASLQERLRASIARGDFAQMEVAALKPQIPKHPVKVGEWVKASNGAVAQVLEVHKDWYLIARGHGWTFDNCEPCDPPATHDTPEGRSVAESVIRDFRTTEPAADIKEGDIVEVVSATHKIHTDPEDIGLRGVVTAIAGMRLSVRKVPGYELPICGIVGKCDVRKVTT